MRRRLAFPVVLLLLAAGCSSTDEESQARPTDQAEREEAAMATCQAFFEGTGTPLAERAEEARAALAAGEVVDGAPYGEVNALEQRVRELSRDAHAEVVPVLADVAAPFTAAVAAVNDAREQEAPEGEEPTFPDLSQIDVSGSASAQERFQELCDEAGYEVP